MEESIFYTRELWPTIHSPGADFFRPPKTSPNLSRGPASRNNAVRFGGVGATGEEVRISGATRLAALSG
jgi:hypothetical protein